MDGLVLLEALEVVAVVVSVMVVVVMVISFRRGRCHQQFTVPGHFLWPLDAVYMHSGALMAAFILALGSLFSLSAFMAIAYLEPRESLRRTEE